MLKYLNTIGSSSTTTIGMPNYSYYVSVPSMPHVPILTDKIKRLYEENMDLREKNKELEKELMKVKEQAQKVTSELKSIKKLLDGITGTSRELDL